MLAVGWTAPRPQEDEHDFSTGKALAGDPRSVTTACGVRAPKWSNPLRAELHEGCHTGVWGPEGGVRGQDKGEHCRWAWGPQGREGSHLQPSQKTLLPRGHGHESPQRGGGTQPGSEGPGE